MANKRNSNHGSEPPGKIISIIDGGKQGDLPSQVAKDFSFNIFEHIAEESERHILQCQKIAERTGLGKTVEGVRLTHEIMVDFWNLYGLFVEED